jgi:hypothetical protein
MNERIMPDVDLSELKGDITFGPFSNPHLNAVLKHFGKIAFGRSSACMEFESFLRQIGAGGKTCLEIGTFHGITAVVLSQFFERVICVSIDDPNAKLLKHQIVKFLGITNISFYDAKTNAEKAAFVNAADFDFCYQDGDHTNDTPSDFALVKRCGRVLFHEYWPLQPPVWNLVNSLPQDEITRAQFDCFAMWTKK